MDETGVILTEPIYERVGFASEGMIQVTRNGNIGFVDSSGSETVPCEYSAALDFEGGMAFVRKEDNYFFVSVNNDRTPISASGEWNHLVPVDAAR